MAKREDTLPAHLLEEALTVLFCLVDDAYFNINPKGGSYASLKKLSDSEVMTLALFQQLRGVESERSFLRDVARFFSHLFPDIVGFAPSSFHRQVRNLRCLLEPLRRSILPDLVGEPETLIIDSTLLSVLHPRQVLQSAGFEGAAWVRWGSFSVYGVKLHLVCATNRVPVCYELTAANVADVRLVGELLAEVGLPSEDLARKLLGDLAYRSADLQEELAEAGVLLVTERNAQGGKRQQAEIAFSSLKRVFGIDQTLAKTLVGLVTRIVVKVSAYTYAFYVNRLLSPSLVKTWQASQDPEAAPDGLHAGRDAGIGWIEGEVVGTGGTTNASRPMSSFPASGKGSRSSTVPGVVCDTGRIC